MVITSQQNPRVKYVRRLLSSKRFRQQEKSFVIEGSRWLDEALQFPGRIKFVLCSAEWISSAAHREMMGGSADLFIEIDSQVIASISQLESSEGVLAVLSIEEAQFPVDSSLLLIADGVSDPGNLGTMIRTAAALAVDGLVLAPGCVDPYNPKVVRSSKGAHLRVPLATMSWGQIIELTSRMEVWIAEAGDHLPYFKVDWTSPSALVAGGEAAGASQAAREQFSNKVAIPLKSQMESLNVAVASAVILSEAARQRATGGEVY